MPRTLPAIGLIGTPPLPVTTVGAVFDLWLASGTITALGALPVAAWEFSLGVYLVVKGVRTPRA